MLLLELSDIRGRNIGECCDCGLLLRSVCDLAAGLASISAAGTGAVARRPPLVVRLLRLEPSSPELTSKWVARIALIDGGGLLCSPLWLIALGVLEWVLCVLVDPRMASSPDVSLDSGAEP